MYTRFWPIYWCCTCLFWHALWLRARLCIDCDFSWLRISLSSSIFIIYFTMSNFILIFKMQKLNESAHILNQFRSIICPVKSWNFLYIISNSLIAVNLNAIYILCDVGPVFKRFHLKTDKTKRASTVKVVKLLMSTQFRKITLYTDNNKTKPKETYRNRSTELSMCKSSKCK